MTTLTGETPLERARCCCMLGSLEQRRKFAELFEKGRPEMRRLRFALTVGTLVLAACAATDEARIPPASLKLAPCSLPGIDRLAECGTVDVPENRERPGRTIALRLVVVRATQASGREGVSS